MMTKTLFSDEPPFQGGRAVFLAGPTPRSKDVPSWRPQAIEILTRAEYPGTILIPERKDWSVKFEYTDQVEWEKAGLHNCTEIVFWVPRDLQTMPALTTNVEFGYWMAKDPRKVWYGRPPESPKNRYLDWLYEQSTGRLPIESLEDLLKTCVAVANTKQFKENLK